MTAPPAASWDRMGPAPARVATVLGVVGLAVIGGARAGGFADWPGVVHLVALPPLDLYADVRLVVARLPNRGLFGPALVAVVGARMGIWWLVFGRTRTVARALAVAYLAAAPVAVIATALDAAGRAALYTQLVWAGLGVTVLGGGLGMFRLARRVTPATWDTATQAGLLGAYGTVLAVLGLVGAGAGGRWPAGLVPLSAAATAGVVALLTRPVPPTRLMHRVWVIPAVAVTVLGAVAVWSLAGPTGPAPRPAPRPGSVLLVPGVASATGRAALFRLDPRRLGYRCDQVWYFSYAGTGPGLRRPGPACPIRDHRPYRGRDTMASLDRLVASLAAQARPLPRPLVLVTHSQGAWIAHEALATGRVRGVSHLVMLGPFARTLRPYPPPGRGGAGAVAGDALRVLSRLGRAVGFTTFDPDGPLPAGLQGRAGAVPRLLGRPRPAGVRALAIVAVLDLPLVYADDWARHGATRACPRPTTHTGLVTDPGTLRVAAEWLEGIPPARCRPGAWTAGPLTAPFGVPAP